MAFHQPETLSLYKKKIARFIDGGFADPLYDYRLAGLSDKYADWLTSVTAFHDAIAQHSKGDEQAYEAEKARLLTRFGLKDADLFRFARGLRVRFASGVTHAIDRTAYRDGRLEWCNGEKL